MRRFVHQISTEKCYDFVTWILTLHVRYDKMKKDSNPIEVKIVDKNEFRTKIEQMLELKKNKLYDEAFVIAEELNWEKVKNSSVLCAVSEIYEQCGEYEKSRDILFMAYERSPESKKIIYRLGTLALKLGEFKEASDCYEEFVNVAPKDPNRFVLKYKCFYGIMSVANSINF